MHLGIKKRGVVMAFPNDKKLKEIRAKLEAIDPSRSLPENPSKVQIVKYKICEKFVLNKNK